jgi:hypothetical protein
MKGNMKPRRIRPVSKFILLGGLLIFCLACSLSPQGSMYESEAFSFNIPKGWLWVGDDEDYMGLVVQKVVGIRNPQGLFPTATFTVATAPLTGQSNLEAWFTQVYEGRDLLETGVKIKFRQGELSGFEISYTHPKGEALWGVRDIWLENNAVIYILSFRACCNSFGDYSNVFEQILASFHFKE